MSDTTVVAIVWASVQWEPLLGRACCVCCQHEIIRSRAGFDVRHSLEVGQPKFVVRMV